MARTDTLPHFLTDVADAIREKKGSSDTIQASDFDTEIENLPSGGDLTEYFNTTIDSSSYRATNSILKLPTYMITSDITSLAQLFASFIPPVSEIKVSGDGTNVTSIGRMFYQGATYKKVILDNLDLSNATTFNSMFYQNNTGLYGPSEVVLNITTSNKITQIADVFRNCSFLTSISGLNNINATNCTSFTDIFNNCWGLASIDISGWNPSGQFRVDNMFKGCSGLRHLDIRGLTLTNITNYGSWLSSVPTNCEIIVKDQTQKDWMTTNFSNYTNVKTVAEYEAE